MVSCRREDENLVGGFPRLAAFAAMRVLQSKSVLGRRGESPGVLGEGDDGREPDTDPVAEGGELVVFGSKMNSALSRCGRRGA